MEKLMLLDRTIFYFKCEDCDYEIAKEHIEIPICPMCNPNIMVLGIEKIIKEMKEERNGKNSSDKA